MSEQNKAIRKTHTRVLAGTFGTLGLAMTMTLINASPAGAMLVDPGGGGVTTPTGTFGTANIAKFTDGLEFYALIACLAAILISAILWAVGSKGQNPGQELTGKRGLILAVTAAFLIGAIPGIMGFLETQSHKADSTGVTTAQAGTNTGASNCSLANSHNATC